MHETKSILRALTGGTYLSDHIGDCPLPGVYLWCVARDGRTKRKRHDKPRYITGVIYGRNCAKKYSNKFFELGMPEIWKKSV